MSAASNDNGDSRADQAIARFVRDALRRPRAAADDDPLNRAREERNTFIPEPTGDSPVPYARVDVST